MAGFGIDDSETELHIPLKVFGVIPRAKSLMGYKC
jgi:hypothetical protein